MGSKRKETEAFMALRYWVLLVHLGHGGRVVAVSGKGKKGNACG